MAKPLIKKRWIFVLIIFVFLIIHQFDIRIFGPRISELMLLSETEDQVIVPFNLLAVLIGLFSFLFWGYLYDGHTRKKLFSAASFLWGVTSLLMGVAPTASTYLISNALGTIDNASYSGIFAVAGDFFGPKNRGKILGLLLVSQPLAFLLGLILSNGLENMENWRIWLFVIGAVAFFFSLLIHFSVPEPKRGAAEPAMVNIEMTGVYLFDWDLAKNQLKKSSLLLLFSVGFLNIIPWTVLINWGLRYINEVSDFPNSVVYVTLLPPVFALILGYPVGGFIGDISFKSARVGRVFPSLMGSLMPSLFILFAFMISEMMSFPYIISMTLLGFFMGFVRPNMLASIQDVTLPEIRGTAYGLFLLSEALGTLFASFIVSFLHLSLDLGRVILVTCVGGWLFSFIVQLILLKTLPAEVESLRRHMAYRSQLELRLVGDEVRATQPKK